MPAKVTAGPGGPGPAPDSGFAPRDILRGGAEAASTFYEARALSEITRGERVLKIKWFILGALFGLGARKQITRLIWG